MAGDPERHLYRVVGVNHERPTTCAGVLGPGLDVYKQVVRSASAASNICRGSLTSRRRRSHSGTNFTSLCSTNMHV